ncbi:MAG: T9SS type A sorting domain-containing protein [Bacteroidales bacterium]|nr:T9SS type A sorting domain-containing protein [Bacteroidales bacterium]
MLFFFNSSGFILYLITSILLPGFVRAQPGALDTGFVIGSGASHAVNVAGVLPDGRIFLGGEFSSFNGNAASHAVCLLPNGTPDAGYTINVAAGGFDGPVRALALQADGYVLAGGLFNNVNGLSRKNIVRLDSTGAVDNTFLVGSGASNEVTHISTNGSRSVLIGFFNTYNGQSVPGFVVLQSDGSIDTSFLLPAASFVNVSTSAVLPGNKILLAGNFTTYQGMPAGRIIQLNADGSIDTSFQPGQGLSGLAHTLTIQPDGRILVGGAFSQAAGQPRSRIARLMPDGSLDTSFNPGAGANGGVRIISLQADGKILIGGDFSTYDGVAVNRIARLLPDGSLDTTFLNQGGTNGTVKTLTLQADGRIIVGGFVTNLLGVSAGRVGRLLGDTCSLIAQISVDTLTTTGLYQLNANAPAGTSYTWIDCGNGNLPIPGANGSSYVPQTAGDFAVVVEYLYCKDTSACITVTPLITGVLSSSLEPNYTVFPNPARERLTIRADRTLDINALRLFDSRGVCVSEVENLSGSTLELSLKNIVPGLYVLEIRGNAGIHREKVLIR